MSIATASDLLGALAASKLLDPAILAKVERAVQGKSVEPKSVAKELVKHGWVTAYQAEQLLKGRAGDLVLGPYVLLEPLGEGGMGQVFKARHQLMNRIVAVKIIRKELLSHPDAIERFHREIRLAAQLDHPHLVRAHDAAQVGDTHFLVMEFAEGVDLQRQVQQAGPLPLAQACAYVRQAALGLQHAADRGLVHRDIKPSNLQLTAQGTIVKILDIGLARSQAADPGRPELTQARSVMGTPDYIAPEQIADPRTVDTRADIYSLGCTFYFLLAGRPPFPVPTWDEKLVCHRRMEPQPIEQIRPDVPAMVGDILRRMMAKQPEQRFQAPAAVADALAPFAALAGPAPVVIGAAQAGAAQQSTVSYQQTLGSPPGVAPGGATPSLINQSAQPQPGWTVQPGSSAYAPMGPATPGHAAPVTAGAGQAAALSAPTMLAPMPPSGYPVPGQPVAASRQPGTGSGKRLVYVLAGCGAVILLLVVLLVIALNKGDKKEDGTTTTTVKGEGGTPVLLINEKFDKVLEKKQVLPDNWEGPGFRVAKDNDQYCLEVSLATGTPFVKLPAFKPPLRRDFYIETYFVMGHPAFANLHTLTFKLEGAKNSVVLPIVVDYAGKVLIGAEPLLPPQSYKSLLPTRFQVTRKGKMLSVMLNDDVVGQRDLGEVTEFDTLSIGLAAGPGNNGRLARIYWLKVGTLPN